ncbi:MAG: GntR family transcriptional regulator [Amphiplicatus sp.]|nr:GntR family transcriptional regulator [Amphiplicatus sp.]
MSPFAQKELAGGQVKTTLVQDVYEVLMQGLDEGVFRPGERIKAAELAKRMGLSRAPVREALHVLAGQGLVEMLPDRGAVLRAMSLKDVIEIYQILGQVATVGVAGAARRIGEGDNAKRVSKAMDRIRAAGKEPPSYRFYLALNDLHYVLNDIAERPRVNQVMRLLNVEYWNRYLAANIDLKKHIPKYVDNYTRMTEAVLAGDWRAAEAMIISHCDWSVSLLEECGRAAGPGAS